MSLNIVALTGRVCADLELKTTASGISVCSFPLAVDRTFVKQGAERQADFINIVCWKNTAEFVCKYFKKGSMIAVDGSIQTRKYEDNQGNKRTAFEIVANNVHFCESKGGQVNANVQSDIQAPAFIVGNSEDFEEINGDDELPF